MTLLTQVMDHSLDEGYAEAARARGEEGSRRLPTTTQGRLLLALGLGLAAVVVTVSGVSAQEAEPALAKQHNALLQRVTDATSAADKLQHDVEALRAQVDQAQRRALRDSGGDAGLSALAGSVGTGAVSGPGLRLVLGDASGTGGGGGVDPRTADGFGQGRLHDRDLQLIVNGLWQAGAEAVSVNGQRLTALSAIRAAGDAILVDNRPLVPPYTVLAIGDQRKMPGAFQDSMGGHYLGILQDSYGIKATVTPERALTLPAAVGFTLRLAVPDAATPAASASVPPSAGASASPSAPSSSAAAAGASAGSSPSPPASAAASRTASPAAAPTASPRPSTTGAAKP
ncbi:DUF881 domain-containing protein [Kitasatospora nipponensis]|uniref:DUF881 domain-containing protein n=2 Tax=Kitasatospora nipponensis TaxID=258049 RepID=A0ABN1WX43_9ACTN